MWGRAFLWLTSRRTMFWTDGNACSPTAPAPVGYPSVLHLRTPDRRHFGYRSDATSADRRRQGGAGRPSPGWPGGLACHSTNEGWGNWRDLAQPTLQSSLVVISKLLERLPDCRFAIIGISP